MGRENKKEAVAALHREQIMKAAERLFQKKAMRKQRLKIFQKHLSTVVVPFMLTMKAKMIF